MVDTSHSEGDGRVRSGFQGQVSDAGQVKRALEDWVERISPSAQGWLGSTAGVAEDGTFVGIARFESAEAAQRNSARAMQGEWWSGLSAYFTSEQQERAAEQQEPPEGVAEMLSEEASIVQDMRYIDLRDPWLTSPR